MNDTAKPDHDNLYDAIVVGAGPAGSTFAEALARASFRVALLEEHAQVGVPTHCSGLVSPRALEIAGVSRETMGLREYREARVWGPGGGTLWLRSDSVQAIAIERDRFDQALARRAADAGASLMLGTKARRFRRDNGTISVQATTPGGEIQLRAPLLVGADGAGSRVARWMGCSGKHEVIPAIKADVTFANGGTDSIEILVGNGIAPGWFGWVIPLPGGRATTGMGATGSPRDHFPAFLDLVRRRFGDYTVDRTHSAPIPLGPARDFVGDGVLLVGAAARQTKPTTGGGVYLGIRAAQLAAAAAARALAQARATGRGDDLAPGAGPLRGGLAPAGGPRGRRGAPPAPRLPPPVRPRAGLDRGHRRRALGPAPHLAPGRHRLSRPAPVGPAARPAAQGLAPRRLAPHPGARHWHPHAGTLHACNAERSNVERVNEPCPELVEGPCP